MTTTLTPETPTPHQPARKQPKPGKPRKSNRLGLLALVAVLAVLAVVAVSIAGRSVDGTFDNINSDLSDFDGSAVTESASGESAPAAPAPVPAGEAPTSAPEPAPEVASDSIDAFSATDPIEAVDLIEPVEPVGREQIQAGLLTAGDVDDNLNFEFYNSILSDWATETASFPNVYLADRVVIDLTNTSGAGVGNTPLTISDGVETQRIVTNSAGRAYLFPTWLGLNAENGLTISSGNGEWALSASEIAQGAAQFDTSGDAATPDAIDIALVLDVTGSMADELAYLTTEFESIVARLNNEYTNVEQRYALVVYRDHGDEFVTQAFDFTTDISDFRNTLASQSAGGGGDFPEAMDAALNEATDLSWTQGPDAARVLVLNADAPPHDQNITQTLALSNQLGADGVRVYSLAASGVDRNAEFIMRTMAATTGGRHMFLTADSGIGGAKLEPTTQCYEVTGLDDLLFRVFATELAGERVEAAPSELIRSVGQTQNGVCA